MSDDFDALLWLRSKQGQYAGYESGSQEGIRHQYFKAAADELEHLRSEIRKNDLVTTEPGRAK